MDQILYDARWVGNHGIARFGNEVQKRLPGLVPFRSRRPPFHPLDPFLLGAFLRREQPELFLSPGYNPPAGWPGTFVFTLHDLNHLRVPENSSALKRAYYRHIIRPACRKARYVLTVSEYSRNQIAEWAGVWEDRIVNVGNGVGPAFTAAGRKFNSGYPYLLYVGSRKAHKNLPRLLQAFAISEARRDLHLLISGQPERDLVNEIDHLGLQRDVIFEPLHNDEELSAAYRGAVAFVFPSLYEGFGLPPVEAMACGTPVLTSDVCSLPEVTGDAAILVNPLDVEEIAAGINKLVYQPALQNELRKRGLLRAKIYSWDETSRRTLRVLELCGFEQGATVGLRAEGFSHAMAEKSVPVDFRS